MTELKLQLPKKFYPMFKPKRVKVYFGGRGGAKTDSFARVALVGASTEGKRYFCLREFMNSIDDSVHSTLKAVIDGDGFTGFDALNNEIRHSSGGIFKYGQLARNISSTKSKSDFDVAWVEEAETITDEALEILEPTIRKAGSEIWYSFNPAREDGAVYAKYVKPHINEILKHGFYEDDDLFVCKVGLEDNPWAPAELVNAANRMKLDDPDKWAHVWNGEPRRDLDDVIIQPKWIDAAIDAHKKLGFQAMGVKSLGFDPADEGSDKKAVALRHGTVITQLKEWGAGDISAAIDRAFSYASDWQASVVVFDADGLGAAVKVGLDQRLQGHKVQVDGYHGGGTPDHPTVKYMDSKSNRDTFKNKRAQYWWGLRDRFEATYQAVVLGRYKDPDTLISLCSEGIEHIDLLKSELSAPKRKRTNNTQIQLESKAEMMKRGVKSPNMADALVMCFANSEPDAVGEELEFDSIW